MGEVFGVELSAERVVVGVAVFLASTLATTAVVTAFLVSIREDHFVVRHPGVRRPMQSPVSRAAYTIGKNLLGAVLVVVGIVLSLPGVPGQGLLTVLVGVLLLDVPGKRRLELAIVRRPAVLRTINRLRRRFGRKPLQVDEA